MKKLVTICAVVLMVLAVSGVAQATMQTYSIVDYPSYEIDLNTGLTDSISGTIMADPTTGNIESATFTLTDGYGTQYTIASWNYISNGGMYGLTATVSPSDITLTTGRGPLIFDGTTSSGNNVSMIWNPSGDQYQGVVTSSDYSVQYLQFVGNADFHSPSFPLVVATIPEPATICLLGLGGLLLRRRK